MKKEKKDFNNLLDISFEDEVKIPKEIEKTFKTKEDKERYIENYKRIREAGTFKGVKDE